MSSQQDGFLKTGQSYHHNREKTADYQANPINSSKFTDWQKDHMYKSSYAHFHSKVTHSSILVGLSRT